MLTIRYLQGNTEYTKSYASAAAFIGRQQLEVPDFEDYVKLTKVTIDGEPLPLKEATMGGLFNQLNQH